MNTPPASPLRPGRHLRLTCTLWALMICAPAALYASNQTFNFKGRGNDGKVDVKPATLHTMVRNNVDPTQNAEDDARYGSQYKRVGPADSRVNCAGDVSNRLFGTGERTMSVSDFHDQIIKPFGHATQTPHKGDVVIFGNDAHIATVVGVTHDPNTVIIRSKDNNESVREGPLNLHPGFIERNTNSDPIVSKNGAPVVYHVEPVKVIPPDGVSLETPKDPPVLLTDDPESSNPVPPPTPPPPAPSTNGGTTQRRDQQRRDQAAGGHNAARDASLNASQYATRDATAAAAAAAGQNAGRDSVKSGISTMPTQQPSAPSTMMCFVAGTLVQTPCGERKIEEFKVGDTVFSFNPRTRKIEPEIVLRTWKSQRADLVTLDLPSGSVTCSQNHRFYTSRKRWLPANLLQPGEKIMQRDTANPARLRAVACTVTAMPLKSAVSVYNITVARNSDYFVGPAAALCHNNK